MAESNKSSSKTPYLPTETSTLASHKALSSLPFFSTSICTTFLFPPIPTQLSPNTPTTSTSYPLAQTSPPWKPTQTHTMPPFKTTSLKIISTFPFLNAAPHSSPRTTTNQTTTPKSSSTTSSYLSTNHQNSLVSHLTLTSPSATMSPTSKTQPKNV